MDLTVVWTEPRAPSSGALDSCVGRSVVIAAGVDAGQDGTLRCHYPVRGLFGKGGDAERRPRAS